MPFVMDIHGDELPIITSSAFSQQNPSWGKTKEMVSSDPPFFLSCPLTVSSR